MKKAYEVTYKDGNKFKTTTVKGHTLVGSLVTLAHNHNIFNNIVSVNEISFESYHIVNTASAILDADCEEEYFELCRLAGIESEWK